MKKKPEPKTEEAIKQEMADSGLENTPVEAIEPEVLEYPNEKETVAQESVKDVTAELIKQKDLEIAQGKDKLMRSLAEFDNFRKRSIKEKQTAYENGIKDITLAILPVLDNFDRALQHLKEEEKESAFAQGIRLIQKQLTTSLAEVGITEIEALGQTCDHNLHEVVSHLEDEQYGENEIIEVYQKGFQYKETVIRHSMVRVAN